MKDWKEIKSEADVYDIIENSATQPQIIFKDSVSCGISAYAKERLQDGYSLFEGKAGFNYLDLLSFRPVSKLIAQVLDVRHQSPQVILLKDRKVIYTTSHHSINAAGIAKYL